MIISIQTKVTFNNRETYPVDNLERFLGNSFEFDCNDIHYFVKIHLNREFETLIGTWNEDEKEYIFKKSEDIVVTKIFRSEEYIDNCSEVE